MRTLGACLTLRRAAEMAVWMIARKLLGRLRRRPSLQGQLAARASAHGSAGGELLVVSHDAHLAGAQRLLLSLLAEWKRRDAFPIRVICVGGGVLRGEFERLYPTLFLTDHRPGRRRDAAIVAFTRAPIRAIYASTVVNGMLLDDLRALGAPIVTHCHELQASIERWAPGPVLTSTLVNSDLILGACDAISANLRSRYAVPRERLAVVNAFVDFWDAPRAPSDTEVRRMRSELGVVETDIVVFGCGTTDWRKGPDLFVEVALEACRREPRLLFLWIGGGRAPSESHARILTHGLGDRIRFMGPRPSARRYFYAGHLFALTSREDPCALVALEAANARLPVVSFEGSGDIPVVLGSACGAVAAMGDVTAFAAAVVRLVSSEETRRSRGATGYDRVRLHHSTEAAAVAVEAVIDTAQGLPRKALGRTPGAPLVSVIVPSYNHARFLVQRLDSVAGQTLRELEFILLDDASTDDSRVLLERFAAREPRARLVCNACNSGSAFRQWRKGLASAQGKYVWIAESDDSAKPSFLATAVQQLENDSSLMVAHLQSVMLDPRGRALGRPDAWLNELAPGRWKASFVAEGIAEVRAFLSQKNTIPNASAVVFRNFPGIELLVDDSMRLCADWLFWVRLLARGRYAFIDRELSYWRQNTSNARSEAPGRLEWKEGQRVLAEVATLLALSEDQRAQMLERFRERCAAWSAGAAS